MKLIKKAVDKTIEYEKKPQEYQIEEEKIENFKEIKNNYNIFKDKCDLIFEKSIIRNVSKKSRIFEIKLSVICEECTMSQEVILKINQNGSGKESIICNLDKSQIKIQFLK